MCSHREVRRTSLVERINVTALLTVTKEKLFFAFFQNDALLKKMTNVQMLLERVN